MERVRKAGIAWFLLAFMATLALIMTSENASAAAGDIWTDDFDQFNSTNSAPYTWDVSGNWTVMYETVSNNYLVSNMLASSSTMVNGESTHGNYSVSASIKPNASGAKSGIIGRYVDSTHYYVLYLTGGNKLELGKQNGAGSSNYTQLKSVNTSYYTSSFNTLTLKMNGHYYEGYLNGTLVLTYSETGAGEVARGKFGVSCLSTCSVDDVSMNLIMNDVNTTYTDREVDFDNWTDTWKYNHNMLKQDMGNYYGITGEDRIHIACDPEASTCNSETNKTLRYTMPQSGYNVTGSGGNIVSWLTGVTEATLEYDVYFDSNGHTDYDWHKGGHMPGFGGGVIYEGDEGGTNGDGLKARLGFDEGADGNGTLKPYLYHTDMPGTFGDTFDAKFGTLYSNTWQHVEIYVKLNDPRENAGEGTGIFRVKLDDELVFEKTDIRYRTDSLFRIDKLMGDFFHGGFTSDYGPDYDQYVHIDNLSIHGLVDAGMATSSITNHSFENPGTSGLPANWSYKHGSSGFERSGYQRYSGGYSLKVTDDSATNDSVGLESVKVNVSEFKKYKAEAKVFINGGNAAMYLLFWNGSDDLITPSVYAVKSTPQNQWATLSLSAFAPAGAVKASILLYSAETQTANVYYDDIQLSLDEIANPGFEEAGLTGWTTKYSVGGFTRNSEHFSGAASVKLVDNKSDKSYWLESSKLDAVAGKRYAASTKVKISSGTAWLYLRYWDAEGKLIDSDATSKTSPTNTWIDMNVTSLAPTGTAKVSVLLYSPTGQTNTVIYFDDVRLSQFEIENPGFEGPASGTRILGWNPFVSDFGFSRDSQHASGQYSLKLVDTNSSTTSGSSVGLESSRLDAVEGRQYTASAKIKAAVGQGIIYLRFQDANGQLQGDPLSAFTTANNWTNVSVSGVAPEGTVKVSAVLYSPQSQANTAYFDDVNITAD